MYLYKFTVETRPFIACIINDIRKKEKYAYSIKITPTDEVIISSAGVTLIRHTYTYFVSIYSKVSTIYRIYNKLCKSVDLYFILWIIFKMIESF